MRRALSAFVVAMSLVTGALLPVARDERSVHVTQPNTSHDSTGWNDRTAHDSTPVLEAVTVATVGPDRSVAGGLAATPLVARRHRHASAVDVRVPRPHDPPHLHTFALLI